MCLYTNFEFNTELLYTEGVSSQGSSSLNAIIHQFSPLPALSSSLLAFTLIYKSFFQEMIDMNNPIIQLLSWLFLLCNHVSQWHDKT